MTGEYLGETIELYLRYVVFLGCLSISEVGRKVVFKESKGQFWSLTFAFPYKPYNSNIFDNASKESCIRDLCLPFKSIRGRNRLSSDCRSNCKFSGVKAEFKWAFESTELSGITCT